MLSVAAQLLLCSCCLPAAAALKFLVVPMPGDNSPVLDIMSVAAQLQSRGHTVIVAADPAGTAFAKMAAARHSSNTTAEAMQYITLQLEQQYTLDSMVERMASKVKGSFSKSKLTGIKLLLQLQEIMVQPCHALLKNATLVQQLRALEADAVMGMALPGSDPTGDSCGCMLSHALGIHSVVVNGCPLLQAPLNVPQMGTGNTPQDLSTAKGFAKNLAVWSLHQAAPLAIELIGSPWLKARRDLGLPRVHSQCPLVNAVAWLRRQAAASCTPVVETALTSWLLEYPRPLPPHQVLVGPGSPRAAHVISQPDVAAFLDSAPAGVVLMATGTTPQPRIALNQKDILELAAGFAELAPVRVLWPLKQRALPDGLKMEHLPLGENTLVVPWVDYNDVLGHPNTRVLVSHGGYHSVYEAMFHAVPVVGAPFQFEQEGNLHKLATKGMAVMLPDSAAIRKHSNDTFQRQQVADTIRQVLDNPSYAAAAQQLSRALQAYSRARSPYERAADEIELAINARKAQQEQLLLRNQPQSRSRDKQEL